jgi:uncharacterized membrane protein YagU involved in acid resistance
MTTGLIAGLTATAPMTVAMELMHRRLPRHEQYPLPPRQITMKLADEVGLAEHLDEPQRRDATLLGHFAYGALTGALYGPIAKRVPGNPLLKGAAFGVGLWAASYAGWLPAAGIMPPPARQPARRNALMILAHVVWGAATGLVADRLEEAERGAFSRSPAGTRGARAFTTEEPPPRRASAARDLTGAAWNA